MQPAPIRRSRLVKQESKRLARQTTLIVLATIVFLIAFVVVGIPSLMKLAVAIGNSKASSKFSTQDDSVAPLPPQLNPLPEATSDTMLTVNGLTEVGATIKLYVNDQKKAEAAADNQGSFTFTSITLDQGSNAVYALAFDPAGNQSQPSVTQTVVLDSEAPELTLDSPRDGDRYYGELKQIVDVTGTTDTDVQLTVNDRQIVVTGDGSFSSKFALSDGDNHLTFKAKDKAGNETIQEITVNFSK